MDTFEIPLQSADADGSSAGEFWEPVVLDQYAVPSGIDGGLNLAKPPLPETGLDSTARLSPDQSLVQDLGLDGTDRHALAVNRVEAAYGVTEDDQSFWEPLEPLVMVPHAAGKPVKDDLGERFAVAKEVVEVWNRERLSEREKLVVGARELLVEVPTQRDQPTVALDCKREPVSPCRCAADQQCTPLRNGI